VNAGAGLMAPRAPSPPPPPLLPVLEKFSVDPIKL
jgi:hypothetical protein